MSLLVVPVFVLSVSVSVSTSSLTLTLSLFSLLFLSSLSSLSRLFLSPSLSQAKHMGKVLVRVHDPEHTTKSTCVPVYRAIHRTEFRPDRTYLIVGGLGGVGLELVSFMACRGARKFVITSRNGIRCVSVCE